MERGRWLCAGDHLIQIHVSNELPVRSDALVIVVEPTWSVPAVGLALDAGWNSVELAMAGEVYAPIPLISFEQKPPRDATRCRVRCDDLFHCITKQDQDFEHTVLLGAPLLARPLASSVIRVSPSLIHFVACPSMDRQMAADSWWASGMIIRIILEELESKSCELSDAAGVAVTLAQGAEDVSAQLSASARWRTHLDCGGHLDDLRIASAVDSVGVVPIVSFEKQLPIATAWSP